jgi:hypothetical protein
MRFEFRLPISPVPNMINRALLFAASAREFYPDAVVTACVGSMEESRDLGVPQLQLRWSAFLARRPGPRGRRGRWFGLR